MSDDTHGDLDAILGSPDALLGEDGSLTPTQAIRPPIPGRQILVLMPEGSPGEPDWGLNGTPLGPLPEGTHTLDIQAYWHVTGTDGKFRGGATGMKIELEES